MLNRRSTFNYVRETFLADEKIVFMRSKNQPVVPAASLLAHSACPQLQAMTSDYSTTTGAKTPKPAEMTVGSLDRPVRSEPASRTAEVAPLDIARVISEINDKLQDAFFDYDRSEVRPDAVTALQQDVKLLLLMLSDFPRLRVIIEGHCDECASGEYNLALGDRRASRATEVLLGFGLPAASSQTISYEKEAPHGTEAAESCWQRNRRVHLVVRP